MTELRLSLPRKMPAFLHADHEQHYQAVQKFRNSYVHFWCGENLGEKYGIPQNAVFYPQNTEAIDELDPSFSSGNTL